MTIIIIIITLPLVFFENLLRIALIASSLILQGKNNAIKNVISLSFFIFDH